MPLSAAEVCLSHIASVLPELLYEICGYFRVLTHFYYNIPQSAIEQVTDIFLFYSLWLRFPVEVGWDIEAKRRQRGLYLSFGLLLVDPSGIGNGLPHLLVVQRSKAVAARARVLPRLEARIFGGRSRVPGRLP